MILNFIKNKITFLWLLIVAWFVLWTISLNSIPKESSPAIDLPIFIINSALPWANPTKVETDVTNKLEKEFKSISGVKKIESVSNFNFSTVIITFNDNKNLTDAKLELTETINKINLPTSATKPTFRQVSPDDSPVYSLSVTGNYLSKEIYAKVKKLEDNLKTISWVSSVNVIWKPDKNINIYLDEKKINQFWVNIWLVKNILSNSFINTSIWKKDIEWHLYNYEVQTYEANLDRLTEQIKDTNLINVNWQTIKVKDVANVYVEENSKIEKSFIVKNNEAVNSISFDIKVSPGNDVEKIIKQVLAFSEDFKKENPDLQIYETSSRLTKIQDVFNTFFSNFWQSWTIILVILFLFIWARMSLWVTIAFPLVYMITFVCLQLLGYSFNNVVSFSLVLTLWIMVDNLIVITEWIVNELKEKPGIDFWEAVKNTFKKYSFSIIAWTATTIAMFAPLYFMLSWTIWKFIAPLSITIIVTLSVSILVAIFLLPIILRKVLKKWSNNSEVTYFWKKLEQVSNFFWNITKKFLKNKFTAFLTVIGFWWIFITTMWLVSLWIIKTDFMPPTDMENIWINIEYPSGFSNENNQNETNKIFKDISNYIEKDFKWYVDYYYVNIWNIYSLSMAASSITADNQAYINIKLVDSEKRKIKSYDMTEKLQNFLNNEVKQKYPNINEIYTVSSWSMSWWKSVWFSILWNNLNEISNYIEKILPEVEKIPWVYNLTTNLNFTNWKIKYFLDLNEANRNWTSIENMVLLLSSIKNSNYQPNWIPLKNFSEFWDDDVSMVLYTNYEWNIEDLKIWKNFGSRSTKERKLEAELKNISHLNSKIQIFIEADKKSTIALSAITERIDKIIEKNPLPNGLEFKYNSNISDQAQSQADLWVAFWAGIALMFLVLVFQFNSVKLSLIVLTSTILSLIWVIIFLAIFELPLSFPAQLWLFWVIWVWINNSILFTDLFSTKEQKNIREDLANTIKERFSAIFLTTFTTISWLITLAVKDELWWSLAVAFIGWLTINVAIVLIYLPAFFFLITKQKK